MTRESTNGRVRRSLAEWRTLCERFARSGLGAEEFCLREKLTVSSFKKWYRRSLGEEQQGNPFIELVPPSMVGALGDSYGSSVSSLC